MPAYFFDSSALVKLYHSEVGTPVVDDLVTAANNRVRISRLAPAELMSAFAIKVRTQAISREDAAIFIRQFRSDIATARLEVFTIPESAFANAESLVQRHAFQMRLRALDALQLGVAVELRDRNLVDFFVAADKVLCEVAGLEGFSVINPEQI